MKCPQCGYDNKPNKQFCTECGAKLILRCPQCDSEIEETEKFCGACGFDLKTPTGSSAIDYSEPHSYTPMPLTTQSPKPTPPNSWPIRS
jgi:hypothetical protein